MQGKSMQKDAVVFLALNYISPREKSFEYDKFKGELEVNYSQMRVGRGRTTEIHPMSFIHAESSTATGGRARELQITAQRQG